ncbi:MAG: YlaH-like family protein [Tuberibacillus sp.]
MNNPYTAHYASLILFLTIVVLSIIVYKLGFARKLPILKSVVIYVFMLIGCVILTFLAYQLPIVGALFVSAVVLVIYKIRLHQSKKNRNSINKEA